MCYNIFQLLSLFDHILFFLAGGGLFKLSPESSLSLFDSPSVLIVNTKLLLRTCVLGSYCTFLVPELESAIYPQSSLFLLRNGTWTHRVGPGSTHRYWISCYFYPFQWAKLGNTETHVFFKDKTVSSY